MLLALIWAVAYKLVLVFNSSAIDGNVAAGGSTASNMLYFSFVILTTTGYGDISPLSVAAGALSNLESLVGELFPANLIARLVSKEIAARQAGDK